MQPAEIAQRLTPWQRALLFAAGIAIILGGVALFGAGFDFIDAHINWPMAAMMPALVLWSAAVTALVVIGGAMMLAAVRASLQEMKS